MEISGITYAGVNFQMSLEPMTDNYLFCQEKNSPVKPTANQTKLGTYFEVYRAGESI